MSIKIPKLKGGGNIEIPFNERLDSLETQKIKETKIKQTVDTAPTYEPKTFYEQFVLYKNGATFRLYIYMDNAWKYITIDG